MSSNVKSDVDRNNYQGSTANTFIKEIIGEMKNKFNKSEHKIGVVKTDNEEKKVNIDIKVGEGKTSPKNVERDSIILNLNHSAKNEDSPISSKMESHLFIRPSDEVLLISKDTSPVKQPDDDNDGKGKSAIKRSLRSRGKNSSESILQSAIARKEKSYNESNKPQRLSRQRRSKTIVDNTENVEKFKQITDTDLQFSDGDGTNDGGIKKPRIVKMTQKKLKMSKSNFSDGIESDSLESISDDGEILKNSLQNHSTNMR